MSYDLHFHVPRHQAPPLRREVEAWFRPRRHFQVGERAVVFSNRDSGVNFAFHFPSVPAGSQPVGFVAGEGRTVYADADPDGPCRFAGVSLWIPCARPYYFGEDAKVEILRLVRDFGLLVVDPQVSMEARPFEPSLFDRTFAQANAAGYLAVAQTLHEQGAAIEALGDRVAPSRPLEVAWRWNRFRAALRERLPVEVAALDLLWAEGQPRTHTYWLDARPVALPKAERVVLISERLSGARRLAMVGWREVAPLLGPERREGERTHPYHLTGEPGPGVLDLFQRAPAVSVLPDAVPLSEAMEREAIERALASVEGCMGPPPRWSPGLKITAEFT